MTRYHMFIYDVNESAKCVTFYCTDTYLLDSISVDAVERFSAARIEGDEIEQTGEMTVYFKGPFDFRIVEHYINRLLCFNGWEPYGDYCFRLRYEE